MEGPVSQAPWSPDFVVQALELLVVHRGPDGIVRLRPLHAASLQLGWPPGTTADAVLIAALGRYGLEARVLHSTSWRHDPVVAAALPDWAQLLGDYVPEPFRQLGA